MMNSENLTLLLAKGLITRINGRLAIRKALTAEHVAEEKLYGEIRNFKDTHEGLMVLVDLIRLWYRKYWYHFLGRVKFF